VPRAATLLAVLALVLGLAAAGCGGDDEKSAAPASRCTPAETPEARENGGATAPTQRLDDNATYRLTFRTNCGEFTVTLDQGSAPWAAASLVALAEGGFFDDTIFHRVVPGFVIQGGDPTQTGGGGPGYSTVDEPSPDASYVKGVVAMAKASQEPSGTAGSQFFVVTADDAELPPAYAVVGKVTAGIDVVERIDALGDPSLEQNPYGNPVNEQPVEPVVIETVEVRATP
jgi:cyclophilin family peptidyl-prolyl cis-trans isomerase